MTPRQTAAAALAALAVAACGPSFQVVYEGDARFEHCYALDETATVSMQEKTECWTQWSRSYTYGQTRNKIDYAATRAKALRDVPASPTDEAVMSAAPGGGAVRPLGQDEPVPTSAFTPPPQTMRESDAGPAPAPVPDTAPETLPFTPFVPSPSRSAAPAAAASAPAPPTVSAPPPLDLVLGVGGLTQVGATRVTGDAALLARVREAVARATDGGLRVVMKIDERVPHGRVVHVLDLLKQAGVTKIAFAVVTGK